MATAARQIVRSIAISRVDESRREVFGEVGVPLPQFTAGQVVTAAEYKAARDEGRIHYDGGCWTADDLLEMAHRFLSQAGAAAFDQEHDRVPGIAVCIESFVATATMEPWTEGAWVVGCKILDDDVWAKVLDKTYKGFSVRMLAVDDIVEIVLDDDAATRIKLIYFRDPTPILMSVVGKPATGVPFEFVRFVTDPAAALPDLDAVAAPSPETETSRAAEVAPEPAPAPAAAEPAPIPVVEERSMSTAKPGLLARIVSAISRSADTDPEAKALLGELGDVPHAINRAMTDFAARWADGAASADTWRAFDLLQYCVWDYFFAIDDGGMAAADCKVDLGTCIDQFKDVLLAAMDKVVVDRAEGGTAKIALRTPAAALSDHVRFVTESAIDRAGKKLSTANRAKVDEAMAAAQAACDALQGLIDSTDETATDNACKDKTRAEAAVVIPEEVPMNDATKTAAEALRAELATLKAEVEALRAEEKPIEPAALVVEEPDPAVEALRSETAALKVEVERLRSMRPAPQAAAPDVSAPAATDRGVKDPIEVFRSANNGFGFLSGCLLAGGFSADQCEGGDDAD